MTTPLTLTPATPGSLSLSSPYPLTSIGVYNVKDYGAAGDGTTDDTAAIQAAIDTASGIGGATVLFPSGLTYRAASTIQIKDGVRLVGTAPSVSTTPSKIAGDAGVTIFNVADAVYHWSMEHLLVHGGAIGLKISGRTSHVILDDVYIAAQTGDGIQTDQIEKFEWRSLTVQGVGGYGIRTGVVVAGNGSFERGVITNLRIDTTGDDGFFMDGTAASQLTITLLSPQFILIGKNGLHIKNGSHIFVSSMSFENASTVTDNTYDGVVVEGSSSGVAFVGCENGYSGISANGQRYGWNITAPNVTCINCAGSGKTKGWSVDSAAGALINCSGTAAVSDWFTGSGMRASIFGGSLALDAQTSSLKPNAIPSGPGNEQVFFLEDTNNDGSGTLGASWQWRKSDSGRTLCMELLNSGVLQLTRGAVKAVSAVVYAGAPPAGSDASVSSGTGSPESAVTAPIGSLYLRLDGGAATSLYVKESGTGNTGWVAK